ncbi:gamma-glutamyl-gamma-aminobutyrate hydrolase family protein [Inhella gelatinilytica]|uniref:Gamma-glutamyl-gamma-aminobutyrate hydrolase family protein n=1 Tax=Inhella gelatinilytica TaxID=2795030 RepID=A0A931IV00_9BURK|nr:gamma-glutamyl-gamma-aminobutyrate hydrolase family protein [Inhella gelatinilytica]MBH9551489.1 gamma-glutamyl-gamma-aminobutyrate hydrolase family protein [Inhella gelatinilytica]
MKPEPLRIGLSARLLHQPPRELGFRNKTLHYLEQSIAHWVLGRGALVFMIPALGQGAEVERRQIALGEYAAALDGLVLQGGADMSPQSYGELPQRPEWEGDPVRDRYELELLEVFLRRGRPVLGICRGCQLINVAFGGTLYQDLSTQRPDAITHYDPAQYDQLHHAIELVPDSRLAALYPEVHSAKVTSLHHQAIARLGGDLQVEAMCPDDGIVEAIRGKGVDTVVGVQWHPEFHPDHSDWLSAEPLMDDFLAFAKARRQ